MIIFIGSKKIDEIHSQSVQKEVEQEQEAKAKEAKN
jgi:hypothetical protein